MRADSHVERLGVVRHDAEGTPAATWDGWSRSFPLVDLTGWNDVLVVAPHPDDEVLGVGGLLARLAQSGARLQVAAVTDGDAAYPHSRCITPAELGRVRTLESAAACAVLGVAPPARFGFPDGAVADHERELRDRLIECLRPGVHCLATWAGDGHPDHEAVGRAAAQACDATGAVLVEYPVWMWHWAQPDEPSVPWDRAQVLLLSDAEVSRKQRAVEEFVSQVTPLSSDPADAAVLPPFVLDRLVGPRELVLW